MSTMGRTVLTETTGRPVQLTADGSPEWKTAGVTVDWSTVAAVSGADVTYLDDTVVVIGKKGMRIGQVLTKITASGEFGPYDSAAVDGRQLMVRGEIYILNQSVLEDELGSDHPPVIEGGLVWRDRLLISTGAASLAAGPTVATFETAFPRIRYVKD